MNRQEKTKVVEYLSGEFSKSQAIIVCNYSGINVPSLESLRANARDKGSKVQVSKNKLAMLAFEKAGVKDISLSGTNIFVWGEDQISVSKVVASFAKENEAFVIKTAVVEKEIVGVDMIESLSKLPGREELLGMLLSVWSAPARNFVTGLDNLRDKKENE